MCALPLCIEASQDVTQFEDEIRKLQQMPSPELRRDQLSLLPRDRGDGKGKKN